MMKKIFLLALVSIMALTACAGNYHEADEPVDNVNNSDGPGSKVYFTKNITPESLVNIYQALGVSAQGKRVLPQLEALTSEMTSIGKKYGVSCSQVGIAWAIAKGTMPIIGATKERHVIEAADAAKIQLTAEEVAHLEQLADATGIDTRGGWEHSME